MSAATRISWKRCAVWALSLIHILFSRIFHNFALKLASVSIGALIYYIVIQLVLTLGFDANLLKLLSASVVAVFLAVPLSLIHILASDSVIYFTSVKRTLFDPLTISARSAASCWLQGLEICFYG